jgi:hypothetical protein
LACSRDLEGLAVHHQADRADHLVQDLGHLVGVDPRLERLGQEAIGHQARRGGIGAGRDQDLAGAEHRGVQLGGEVGLEGGGKRWSARAGARRAADS